MHQRRTAGRVAAVVAACWFYHRAGQSGGRYAAALVPAVWLRTPQLLWPSYGQIEHLLRGRENQLIVLDLKKLKKVHITHFHLPHLGSLGKIRGKIGKKIFSGAEII